MATKPIDGPDGSRTVITRDGVEYLVRPFRDGDTGGFLSLVSSHVTDADLGEEWFRKTYVENPYVDHVPMFVIETDGEIVGARPFTAFRIQAGGETTVALLTRDTLVHPDHRRRGLFTAMTKLALGHYETAEPTFFFSHSNDKSRPGYQKMGWTYVGGRETYARVQNASDLIAAKTRDLVTALLSPVVPIVSDAYLGIRDRTASAPADITVTRHPTVPERTMGALYERELPEGPHIVRDKAFYRWRFRSPEWQPNSTYIARRDGEPIAGVITVEGEGQFSYTSVVDVVPRTGGERWTGAIASVIDRLREDCADFDILRVREPIFPTGILVERGFLSSDRLPLSLLVDDTRRLTLGVRALGDEPATLGDYPLREAVSELWSVAH